jgi:hypothetical protein
MILGNQVTVICFVGKDDSVVPAGETGNARHFLEQFTSELVGITGVEKWGLQESFFILGGASKAFILSAPSLSVAGECIQSSNNVGFNLSKKLNSSLGAFVLHAFPAIKVKLEYTKFHGILPGLLFVRTPDIIGTVRNILLRTDIFRNVVKLLVSFGAYNLIFFLKTETLTDLGKTISSIRDNLKGYWETSTIIGVPEKNWREKEKEFAASEPFHSFSIMAKCRGSVGEEIEDDIMKIARETEFRRFFQTLLNKQEKITFRQGYVDLDIPCHSQTVGEVFDLACELRRRIKGIINTVTMARIQLSQR